MGYPLIVIAGPTCTGKSATAVRLARRIDGEIVSADSMQVYRGMDIGTAKITPEDMDGVPHHMIDILDPTEAMNVNSFALRAIGCIEDIRIRGKVPIVVGGTGFYIESILFITPDCDQGIDRDYRQRLKNRAEKGELAQLYSELEAKDPEYAATVHPNNRMRVIRALEYMHATGRPYSEYAMHGPAEKRFPFRCFVFDDDRRALYARIDERVDRMISDGLEEEVRRLIDSGVEEDSVPMQGIGYRQMYDHIIDGIPIDDTVRDIKNATRHFAKRQLTWFRHRDYSEWIDISEFGRDPESVSKHLLNIIGRG